MLPKIAVGVAPERNKFISNLGLKENFIMGFEGSDGQINDLRGWINSGIGILRTRPEYTLVIWDAEKLSKECQSVLLKPMEELEPEMKLILQTENENLLLPTILSRGEIIYFENNKENSKQYWNDVRKCWSSGPAACIGLTDDLEKEEAVVMLEEVISKLRSGLMTEINEKRLLILDLAITSLAELKHTNINYKLLLDNFLIGSWQIIKA